MVRVPTEPRLPIGKVDNKEPIGLSDLADADDRLLYGPFRGALAHGAALPVQLVRGCQREVPVDFLAQLRYCKGWLPAAVLAQTMFVRTEVVQRWGATRRGVEISPCGKWVRATATPHSKPDWEATVLRRHDNDIHLAAAELVDARKLATFAAWQNAPNGYSSWDPESDSESAAEEPDWGSRSRSASRSPTPRASSSTSSEGDCARE